MDAIEKLVGDAEIVVAVLGRGDEFVLVPLGERDRIPQEVAADAERRQFQFCGAMGVIDGKALAKSEPDLGCAHTMLCATFAFARLVVDKLKQRESGDSAEWLARLFSLPDPRGSRGESNHAVSE